MEISGAYMLLLLAFPRSRQRTLPELNKCREEVRAQFPKKELGFEKLKALVQPAELSQEELDQQEEAENFRKFKKKRKEFLVNDNR